MFDLLAEYFLPVTAAAVLAVVDAVVIVLVLPWVLLTKRDPTAALAWCLVVLLMPLIGAVLFWVFGYNHVARPLRTKRSHRDQFRAAHPPQHSQARRGADDAADLPPLARLALAADAFPLSRGNKVTLYHDTHQAYPPLFAAIEAARHHVHLQFFIFRADATGRALIELLARKAKEGVEVRLLYDSMGTLTFFGGFLRPLTAAGGKVEPFLPLNPLQSRIRVNLRNHRKIVVVDGTAAFTGGMNIGDEYLGKVRRYGAWRDTWLKLEGPAVAGLQRVFIEDWDFASDETLDEASYFPAVAPAGDHAVQVVESGPDQEVNTIREVIFAAILAAEKRVWITSPYFVPDASLMDALRLARLRGVEVRLLSQKRPDHWLAYFAARYYFADVLPLGVEVYQYKAGLLHAKVYLVDDDWALVGSPNLDNRSLKLNFEAGVVLYSPDLVAELGRAFRHDLTESVRLDPEVFARRSLLSRLVENACRLFSPLL